MCKKRLGSSIDAFLREEGFVEETQAQAIKEVVAWQLAVAGTHGRTGQVESVWMVAVRGIEPRSRG